MIEELMKQIAGAEERAAEITEKAGKEASDILSGIGAEIDAMLSSGAEAAKSESKTALARAAEEAEKKAGAFLKKELESAKAAALSAEKQLGKAADFIVNKILGA